MPKFFQVEKAAFGGEKNQFSNVKFKKRGLENSRAAEAGTILEIIPLHIKNPPVIQFIAYLDTLQDKFDSKQTAEQPFGRTDPYYMWKSNNRSITVGFSIPASSVTMGLDNLNNLSWFAASLYPTYKESDTATSIAASPMFRVRYANLICSSTNDGQGLPGVIQNLSVTHDVKQGFIGGKVDNLGTSFGSDIANVIKAAGFENTVNEGKNMLIPKLIKVSFTLNVVHDHKLGWDFNTGEFRGGTAGPRFPYDFGLVRETADTPTAGATIQNDTQGPAAAAAPGSADAREQAVGVAVIAQESSEDLTDQGEIDKIAGASQDNKQ